MRLSSILNDFIQADGYLTIEFFIDKYDVSKRTIQSDLSYLTKISNQRGYQLNFRRDYGYLLKITDYDKWNQFVQTLQNDFNLNASQRIQAISCYLIISQDYLTMEYLSEEFKVSLASIKKDMKQVEIWLSNHNLILERKRHYGLIVNGTDSNKRKALLEVYLCDNPYFEQYVKKTVHNFDKISSFVITQIEKENLMINYSELKTVISSLIIISFYALIKLQNTNSFIKTNGTSIEKISIRIKEMIEAYYQVELDESSFEDILELLKNNVRVKEITQIFTDQLQKDIEEFLIETDQIHHTDFSKDETFKKSLIKHVSLLIDRLSKKISYKNSLIKEICVRYPMLFNISIRFSNMLKEKYNVEVTNDEAGFIATHFAAHMEREKQNKLERFNRIAVICSSGGGSAYLIKLQIESIFKKANVEAFSFTQMEEVENYDPDLIFTILPLQKEFSVPVIHIKELLDELDLIQIRQMLQYENCDSFILADTKDTIYSLFRKEFFEYSDANDYMKLIKEMALKIENSEYGQEHYADYVLEREKYMNTIYMNGISIAHPINLCSKKNLVSVTILKNPIHYENKEVRIVFMVCLRKEEDYIHKQITEKLFQFMNHKNQIQKVIKQHTFEDLIVALKEMDGGSV
ncbi:MAG: BglG family transcription antiterminator [Floccifex porci]|uniref:BglG family transcription antiterminator n=1 Tax=Floccifex porci TaxID=2606629 RepID=UPI0023F4CF9D|nr:BglG family transcription antiterminator [Floccifex porci]MDD7466320.1 BglG family transcription antiterminator [Floccifex porci]